jgi:hypothetical protein
LTRKQTPKGRMACEGGNEAPARSRSFCCTDTVEHSTVPQNIALTADESNSGCRCYACAVCRACYVYESHKLSRFAACCLNGGVCVIAMIKRTPHRWTLARSQQVRVRPLWFHVSVSVSLSSSFSCRPVSWNHSLGPG